MYTMLDLDSASQTKTSQEHVIALRLINALCLTGKQQIPDRYSNTRQDLPTLEASMLTIIPPITNMVNE